jgi:hypothetical protein
MRTSRIVGGAAALLLGTGAFVAYADNTRPAERSVGAAAAAPDARSLAQSPEMSRGAIAADTAASGSADTAASGAAAASSKVAIAPAQPRVVKTATITLSVGRDAVGRVAAAVSNAAGGHAGYVAETQRETGDAQSAVLTVRVPAAAFDATLAEVRKLGAVKSESLGGKDVTGSLVDLDARLRSLRAQEAALNALMAKANTVGETLQVAQSVGDVRTQIEELAAQQAQLSDQADFATITVSVLGPHAVVGHGPTTDPLLVHSFKRAGAATLAVLGGVIVVLGYALPTAILAGLAFGLWRLVARRRPVTA